MYPLSLILGIAFYYNEQLIYKYVLPFSVVGIMVSGYHYSLQKVPFLKQFETCKSGIPCSGQYINWFGFITIPFLAFIAFILITAMMIKIKKRF
jgi:disulfide bond formation protein DsbB